MMTRLLCVFPTLSPFLPFLPLPAALKRSPSGISGLHSLTLPAKPSNTLSTDFRSLHQPDSRWNFHQVERLTQRVFFLFTEYRYIRVLTASLLSSPFAQITFIMIVQHLFLLFVALCSSVPLISSKSYQYARHPQKSTYVYYNSPSNLVLDPIPPYFIRPSSIYYIRPSTRTRVVRPLGRLTSSDVVSKTIILNDTEAIPYTKTKAALSTAEYEANPQSIQEEEGVGPAVEFESVNGVIRPVIPPSSKYYQIAVKGTGYESKKTKKGEKSKNKFKSPYEPEVVYSDVYATYVKPPADFKPIIYANRRLDGIPALSKSSVTIPLRLPSSSIPYKFPHGVSSWSLGGPQAFNRGSFWESLASDEALRVDSAPSSDSPSSSSELETSNSAPISTLVNPWMIVPSSSLSSSSSSIPSAVPSSTLYSYQIKYDSSPSSSHGSGKFPSKKKSTSSTKKTRVTPVKPNSRSPVLPNTTKKKFIGGKEGIHSSSSIAGITSTSTFRRVNSQPKVKVSKSSPKAVTVKRVPSVAASSPNSVSSSTPGAATSSSSEGIKTKLPVGLTSWFLGGVRDLTGKHWQMQDISVDNVAVVPLEDKTEDRRKDTSPPPPIDTDVMMTSDGDYERIEPVIVDREREDDNLSPSSSSPPNIVEPAVFFDDDPEFLSSSSNNVNWSVKNF